MGRTRWSKQLSCPSRVSPGALPSPAGTGWLVQFLPGAMVSWASKNGTAKHSGDISHTHIYIYIVIWYQDKSSNKTGNTAEQRLLNSCEQVVFTRTFFFGIHIVQSCPVTAVATCHCGPENNLEETPIETAFHDWFIRTIHDDFGDALLLGSALFNMFQEWYPSNPWHPSWARLQGSGFCMEDPVGTQAIKACQVPPATKLVEMGSLSIPADLPWSTQEVFGSMGRGICFWFPCTWDVWYRHMTISRQQLPTKGNGRCHSCDSSISWAVENPESLPVSGSWTTLPETSKFGYIAKSVNAHKLLNVWLYGGYNEPMGFETNTHHEGSGSGDLPPAPGSFPPFRWLVRCVLWFWGGLGSPYDGGGAFFGVEACGDRGNPRTKWRGNIWKNIFKEGKVPLTCWQNKIEHPAPTKHIGVTDRYGPMEDYFTGENGNLLGSSATFRVFPWASLQSLRIW